MEFSVPYNNDPEALRMVDVLARLLSKSHEIKLALGMVTDQPVEARQVSVEIEQKVRMQYGEEAAQADRNAFPELTSEQAEEMLKSPHMSRNTALRKLHSTRNYNLMTLRNRAEFQ
jgi:hypothetical protein